MNPPSLSWNLLLAEDSALNQKLVSGLLKLHGHAVTVVCNGREALNALARAAFDAVLMDIEMPEMDGLQATAAIRDREKQTGHRLPIIAMTAHDGPEDRQRCLAAGMDAYLAKPVRGGELVSALRAVLEKSAIGPADDQAGHTTIPESLPSTVMDWDRALARAEGDRECLRELAFAFQIESRQLLAQIDTSLAGGDAAAAGRAAHTLQGSARVFAADSLEQAAMRLEVLVREQQFDGATAELAEVRQAVERLLKALDERLRNTGK